MTISAQAGSETSGAQDGEDINNLSIYDAAAGAVTGQDDYMTAPEVVINVTQAAAEPGGGLPTGATPQPLGPLGENGPAVSQSFWSICKSKLGKWAWLLIAVPIALVVLLGIAIMWGIAKKENRK